MLMTRRLPARTVRHLRVRRTIVGTAERPRLVVFRSLSHIGAQLIDDMTGHTLVAADSRSKEFRQRVPRTGNAAAAKAVGELLAERARARGVERVVFDRGGYQYHGRVKALADGARAGGLVF
jgi:large subunit ribosomal protein L18